MSDIKKINKISIKHKTYLLVLLSVVVALVLLLVSNNGLDAIGIEQKKLNLSSDIERYTSKLILEEQRYRLNTNGSVSNLDAANQAYENAIRYVDKIYHTLDTTDKLNGDIHLLKNTKQTKKSTDEYKALYLKGVSILTKLQQQAKTLESEGENITLRIQQYVEAKRVEIKQKLSQTTIEKINNGSNVWQYTYVTRLHEKKYRLSPDPALLEQFKNDYTFMSSEWHRLKKMSDQNFEIKKLEEFNASSIRYNDAMLLWVDLNKQLVTEILPKMRALGSSVIASAVDSAKLSVKQMADKRNNIALTLLLVSIFTITVGIIIGAMIARSISLPLGKLKEQALAISDGHFESKIKVTSKDEIGQLAEAFNHMSTTIANEMLRREQAEKAQRRSQKMDAVGQLTGGIAHDFNNILGIILGHLELLEEHVGNDAESKQHIHVIEKAANRAASLTKQLLSFSRSEATHITTVNINQAISEISEIISRSLTPEIDIVYSFQDNLWTTEIDDGDFSDALLNLCLNARDSITGHGSLTITTHNENIDETFCLKTPGIIPGQYIRLSVTDTGEGIPDELKERIFEPFFTTKDQGKGTGLGLAMVYAFVSRSDGFISCESELGAGTTFHIYLPKKQGLQEQLQQTNKQDKKLETGNETILVVDDEENLRDLAKKVLQKQGYRVLTASDGIDALQQLEKHPDIDLLFSDIVMPNGINGYELAEKTIAIRDDIKILFTSGFAEKTKVQNVQLAADNHMLNKPYRQAELIKHIREILDGKS